MATRKNPKVDSGRKDIDRSPGLLLSPCGKPPAAEKQEYHPGQLIIRLNPEAITGEGFSSSVAEMLDWLNVRGAWIETVRLLSRSHPKMKERKFGVLVVTKSPDPSRWGLRWFPLPGPGFTPVSFNDAEVRRELQYLKVYFRKPTEPDPLLLSCVRVTPGVRYVDQVPVMRIPDSAGPSKSPPVPLSVPWYKTVINWDLDDSVKIRPDNLAVFDTGYQDDSSTSVERITSVNPDPDDLHGHGTEVIRTARSVLPPQARIQSWKITGGKDDSDDAQFLRPATIEDASDAKKGAVIKTSWYYTSLQQVAKSKKIKVINISHGEAAWTYLEKELLQELLQQDIAVVAAAGQSTARNAAIDFPAGYEGVIAVGGAVETSDIDPWDYWGDSRWTWSPSQVKCLELKNSAIELLAPAVNIKVGSWTGTGTSFAAPIVAAALSLIRTKQTSWSIQDCVQNLVVRPKGFPTGSYYKGYGRGLLDWGATQAKAK